MEKTYFLLILLFSIESISSRAAVCDHPKGESLKNDCTNGFASASIDNIGNIPDSCCYIYIRETSCDEYGCYKP